MKHRKLNTVRNIIAMVLCLTIAITGISLSDTTAQAALVTEVKGYNLNLENIADMRDKTISMKIGDTKRFELIEISENGFELDHTGVYDWKTSDENIVSLSKAFGYNGKVTYFTIKAEKAGTAIISGKNAPTGDVISMTVVVEKQKVTAKQKSCKHKWKITKKATCLNTGMKTCKKCKLQKTIAKKEHKWKTYKTKKTTYDTYTIFMCNGCVCTDPETHYYHEMVDDFGCENWCGMEFSEKDYGSRNAALHALYEHYEEYNHGQSVVERTGYCNPKTTTVTVTRCKTCNQTPESLEKYK